MIVVDTGPLVALGDVDDRHHVACRAWFARADPARLAVPAPVLAEACYLIERAGGPKVEAKFLRAVASGGLGVLTLPTAVDLDRAADLVDQYADLPLGGTDAVVIAVAERLDARQVATLDHRHFGIVKPQHCAAFVLLP